MSFSISRTKCPSDYSTSMSDSEQSFKEVRSVELQRGGEEEQGK